MKSAELGRKSCGSRALAELRKYKTLVVEYSEKPFARVNGSSWRVIAVEKGYAVLSRPDDTETESMIGLSLMRDGNSATAYLIYQSDSRNCADALVVEGRYAPSTAP